jgi:acyl carrier protein
VTQALTNEEIVVEVEREIRKLLPEYDGEITLSASFEELDMDSLTRVDLLAAVEAVFDIEVPDDEVANLIRVQDLTELVRTLRGGA